MVICIDQIAQLDRIVSNSSNLFVMGDGWIAKMIALYFEEGGIDRGNFTILQDGKEIERMQGSLIIAEQEIDGRKRALEYESFFSGDTYYLSEIIKNRIDERLMIICPRKYESRVLLERKKELDSQKQEQFDSFLKRWTKKKNELGRIPLFHSIEIETINRCNGTCSFCPVNAIDDKRPYKKMEMELYHKLVDELADMNYDTWFSLFSNNEPLLDERIYDMADYAKSRLPNAYKMIYTNGSLLNVERLVRLLESLDEVCIDIYYDEKIEADMLPSGLRNSLQYCLEHESVQNKIMVQMINRKAIRNNRGGQSKNREEVYQVQATCLLPFIQMIVRPDGKLSLCCNDARGINTMGDLNIESIRKAWEGEKYQSIRKQIAGGRQNIDFCKCCDNYASSNTVECNVDFTEEQMLESWKVVKEIMKGMYI